MKILYHHRDNDYLLSASTDKPPCPALDVYGDGKKYFVPLVDPDDVQASDIRINVGGQTLAPLLTYENAVNILTNRSYADVQAVFNSGMAPYYFKVGDYLPVTFASQVTLLSSSSIAANSTWRATLIGINHNPSVEGYNRGHFAINKNTSGKNICFYAQEMNTTNTAEGGWEASKMRSWLNSTFLNALSSDLRAVISPCTKYSNNTGTSATAATSTSDKLWLWGNYEVFTTDSYHAITNEKQHQARYDYVKNGNSIIHYRHNNTSTAQAWFMRSFTSSATYTVILVGSSGSKTNIAANANRGFIPCFTIGGNS